MLTDSEKSWLERRKTTAATCRWDDDAMHYCHHCQNYPDWWEHAECSPDGCCAYAPDYKDAAEFEARVVLKVAEFSVNWTLWDAVRTAKLLKHARIAVEEEMSDEQSQA